MGLKILHLSDLHIGKSDINAQEIAFSIRDKRVDFILFTGDIIDGSVFSEANYQDYIKKAVSFFKDLVHGLNEYNNNLTINDIFFVPGNHDLDRYYHKDKSKIWGKYNEFLTTLYGDGKIPREYYKNEDWCFFKEFAKEKVIIMGFNSANHGLINGDKPQDYGYISHEQLNSQVKRLESVKNVSEYNIVACLHHHFYLIEERDKNYEDFSVLRNSEEFLHKLNKFNLSLIIHGHKHSSSDKRIIINDAMTESEKISTVISSGSIGKRDVERNYFRYIEIYGQNDPLDLINITYKYENSTFKPQPPIELPFKKPNLSKHEMEDLLKSESELYRAYNDFKDTDAITMADSIIPILDKTIGSLPDSVEILKKYKKCVFYLLMAMHFRCNIHSTQQTFLAKAEKTLSGNLAGDFSDCKDKLFEIYKAKTVYDSQKLFKELIDSRGDIEKRYLTFIAIGIYLTELYLSLSLHSEEFYDLKIKLKSDIEFKEKDVQPNIKNKAIVIDSNEERRAIEVSVECMEATAHKVVSLILNEYEMILNDFDKYFIGQGFRLYYINPQIRKFNGQQLESYTFNAYIPKLIPLLAGESIYSTAEVFARELIQNSIDAIHMRPVNSEEGKINITLDYDAVRQEQTFEITDNGCGMNKYILERYFTTIGRSFYKSDDFDKAQEELGTNYAPISQFGIGFLSCFLVGKRIEVDTKYRKAENDSESQGWFLDVPNFDGCFFIETKNKENVGTHIKIYEDKEKNKFDAKKIYEYIKR